MTHANDVESFPRSVFGELRLRAVLVLLLTRIVVPFLLVHPARAADPIIFIEKKKLWVLQGGEATYALGVNERGELQHLYWAKRMGAEDFGGAHSLPEWSSFDLSTATTTQEYPGWGAGLYAEPSLKATFANGNREVVLHYVDHQLKNDNLEITLKDEGSPLLVHLHYRVYADSGIIERSARIENRTSEAVTLESAQSAAWTLPPGRSYRLHYLAGRWAGEWQLQSENLQIGKRVIESRRGSTGNDSNPWFAIDRVGETDESHGPVWFGELGWSGSWRFTIERTSSDQCRVVGGFNPFDFGYRLAPWGVSRNAAILCRFHRRRTRRGFTNVAPLSTGARLAGKSTCSTSAQFSTTHGRPPSSMLTKPDRWRWRRKPRGLE